MTNPASTDFENTNLPVGQDRVSSVNGLVFSGTTSATYVSLDDEANVGQCR